MRRRCSVSCDRRLLHVRHRVSSLFALLRALNLARRLGTNCDSICPEGNWGFECQYTCPANCTSANGHYCHHAYGCCADGETRCLVDRKITPLATVLPLVMFFSGHRQSRQRVLRRQIRLVFGHTGAGTTTRRRSGLLLSPKVPQRGRRRTPASHVRFLLGFSSHV